MRQTTITGPRGFSPEDWDIAVTNRTGATLAAGSIVMLDLAQAAGEVVNNKSGSEFSGLANVIRVSAAGEGFGIMGVLLESVDNDTSGRARISGTVTALIGRLTGTTAIVPGDPLIGASTQEYLNATLPTTGASEDRILGIMLGDSTGVVVADVPVSATILFDGIHGFGSLNAVL